MAVGDHVAAAHPAHGHGHVHVMSPGHASVVDPYDIAPQAAGGQEAPGEVEGATPMDLAELVEEVEGQATRVKR